MDSVLKRVTGVLWLVSFCSALAMPFDMLKLFLNLKRQKQNKPVVAARPLVDDGQDSVDGYVGDQPLSPRGRELWERNQRIIEEEYKIERERGEQQKILQEGKSGSFGVRLQSCVPFYAGSQVPGAFTQQSVSQHTSH